eukprot:gene9376-12633_t
MNPLQKDLNHDGHNDSVENSRQYEDLLYETLNSVNERKAFKSEKMMAYTLFFFLGIGSLLPWYAFITAQTYFAERLCKSVFSLSFESFFSVSYNLAQPIGLLFVIRYNNSITTTQKVLIPILINTILFFLITVAVFIQSFDPTLLFILTLCATFVSGLVGSVMNGGLFGLSGILPSKNTSALMTGQALAGFFVSLVNFTTSASSPNHINCNERKLHGSNCNDHYKINYAAFAYFSVSTAVLAFCIIFFITLMKLNYIKNYIKLKQNKDSIIIKDTKIIDNNTNYDNNQSRSDSLQFKSDKLSDIPSVMINDDDESNILADSAYDHSEQNSSANHTNESYPSSNNSVMSPTRMNSNSTSSNYGVDTIFTLPKNIDLENNNSNNNSREISKDSKMNSKAGDVSIDLFNLSFRSNDFIESTIKSTQIEIKQVLNKIKIPAFSVFFTYGISLCAYPSIVSLVQSTQYCISNKSIYNNLWVPLIFLIWSICDLFGRIIAEKLKSQSITILFITPTTIWIPAIIRIIFPILLIFCNINSSSKNIPILFNNDYIPLIIIILYAFTNGYIANLSMMFGPTLVKPEESSLAGTIMIFSLSTGLLFGSAFSFLLLDLITGSVI